MKHVKNKIRYSFGTMEDLEDISNVHTKSWQKHYRDILSDDYLDNEITEERLNIWKKRFASYNPNQVIIKAEIENKICGFACHFLDYDAEYGHYLDNLHVLSAFQGLGIGMKLITLSATHCAQFNNSAYYLWVFTANSEALGFYNKIGGQSIKEELFDAPDGNKVNATLIQWPKPSILSLSF